jgi:uncharacterized protein YbbC (DUF1343 family)
MTHQSLSIRVLALSVVLPALPLSRSPAQSVRPGVDVLLTDSLHLIAGKRLGLITNQAGVDARGVSTIDRLWSLPAPRSPLPAPRLVALFAPEHGLRGTAAPGETVADSVDAATGLPIYSLYGARRAPSAAQLAELDVLVVDLPDVGARPWTFVSTMVAALRAAAAAGRRIVVLDRPNPIGCRASGPVLDTAYASFIGALSVPLRHGLTIGELARFANGELHLGADLVVVPVQGWRRCTWFDQTGLPWVRPSPNLPDLASVAWFPGIVLFEATNLSVGRGTDAPFRQIGAPWLDSPALAARLARRGIRADTVTFTPVNPGDGKYPGAAVRGIRLPTANRRDSAEPIRVAQTILAEVRALHPDSLRADRRSLAIRLGVDAAATRDWSRTPGRWRREVRPYLLY